jgi:hypothetical protein
VGRAKWRAWQAVEGKSSEDAMAEYVDCVDKWLSSGDGHGDDDDGGVGQQSGDGHGGPVMSRIVDSVRYGQHHMLL